MSIIGKADGVEMPEGNMLLDAMASLAALPRGRRARHAVKGHTATREALTALPIGSMADKL